MMRHFSTKIVHGVCILLLATLSLAGKAPKAPGLTFLYSVNITGGPTTTLGPGPRGIRFAVPILGGTFSGPKLNGIEPQSPTARRTLADVALAHQEPSFPSAATTH
jgi:hypothetical protein